MEAKFIKIIIVDDNDASISLIRNYIKDIEYAKVEKVFCGGKEFLDYLDNNPHDFDIVLMDIQMQPMDGLDATKLALNKYPNLVISALSDYNDTIFILSLIEAGAKGYLLKSDGKKIFKAAIDNLSSGGLYYSEKIIDSIIVSKMKLKLVTQTEYMVLQFIAKHYKYEDIANCLGMAFKTVESHIYNLFEKTGINKKEDLLTWARNEGLISNYSSILANSKDDDLINEIKGKSILRKRIEKCFETITNWFY